MGRLWYIRHGQSSFNLVSQSWHAAGDPPEDAGFQYCNDYIDAPLTEEGIRQILSNKASILELPIDIVYVSPMLRALETCWILFGECPRTVQVIVNPIFTEWLHVNHDVPRSSNEHREKYPGYDWSWVPESYYPIEFVNERYRGLVEGEKLDEQLVLAMHNALPEIVESRVELYQRVQRAKEFLRQNSSEKNIAIVGHSAFYRHFTAELKENGEFQGERRLENGEVSEIFI